ncbi:MAG: phosphopentomutase [Clostridiales bacterium]|nr:phosphopentomutase [Clostridiales bacterium]
MGKVKRVFIIVLDSFGIGELPDAEAFGDSGSNTLAAVCGSEHLSLPNMTGMGLFNIEGTCFGRSVSSPCSAFGRLAERSAGKDSVIGHWEISGIISRQPLPTYPDGFPDEILDKFRSETGRDILCNKPYSGTKVIEDYGLEHIRTGKLIVYTSGDSVFQIAAHEKIVPVEQLYEYCLIARKILSGRHGVGRVIARPFDGEYPDFFRTENRHDFSVDPPEKTMLDYLHEAGYDTLSVGKIYDIFNGRGISKAIKSKSNDEGKAETLNALRLDFNGLCFTNLVDFDMKFGHRNDIDGYAAELSRFDKWLGDFLNAMNGDDILMITADHGCDPSTPSTDHSREYIPLLVYGKAVKNVDLGTLDCFSDIGKTVLDIFNVKNNICGTSFKERMIL